MGDNPAGSRDFRGIILGDNPAGSRDFFPVSFFKLVMMVLLKIYVAVKIFSKICLKAIRDIFFSNMLSVIRGGKEDWG